MAMVGRVRAPIRDPGTRCQLAPAGLQCACNVEPPVARSLARSLRVAALSFRPMLPDLRHRVRLRVSIALAILATLSAVACAASFDPDGPCTGDGRMPGAYPSLEALVPRDVGGSAPTTVDSGRNCTDRALGSLAGHGVDELRFAGATWETGTSSGVTLAV